MKRFFPFIVSTLLFSVAITQTHAENTQHKIGVLLPLTGELAPFGKIVREGIERATHPNIEFIFEDTQGTSKAAVSGYRKLSTIDKIKFIIGPCAGSPQMAVAPLVTKDSILMLPSSAPGSIFENSSGHIFSSQYSIWDESKFNAQQMNDLGIVKVVIVYAEGEYGREHETAFRKYFPGQIVTTLRLSVGDPSEVKSVALKLKQMDFDALYVPDAIAFMQGLLTEMKNIGIPKKKVFSIYAVQMQETLDIERQNAEGLLFSHPDIPHSEHAIGYFPYLAAKVMSEVVTACRGSVGCAQSELRNSKSFNEKGVLKGQIALRTVKNGRFIDHE